MALSDETLEQIVSNLTPEERKQLFSQLGKQIDNTDISTVFSHNLKGLLEKQVALVYNLIRVYRTRVPISPQYWI